MWLAPLERKCHRASTASITLWVRYNIPRFYANCSEAFVVKVIHCTTSRPEAEFLLAIHSHLYSFALRFLFLQTHATSYSFWSSVTVHRKGERKKTWKKTIPPSLWFKKSIQKPQVWELWRLCPETSTILYVHEFGICFDLHVLLRLASPASTC